jgi:ferredoxin
MRVIIDKEICSGHGRCYSLAPAVFDADDYGKGVIVGEDLPEDLVSEAQIAVQNCPERAISITE